MQSIGHVAIVVRDYDEAKVTAGPRRGLAYDARAAGTAAFP
jgi:hypothetical protein